MGALSGLISIPVNAFISSQLKKDELQYQHKLDLILKQRELLLQHSLEMKRQKVEDNEIVQLRKRLEELEKLVSGKSNE